MDPITASVIVLALPACFLISEYSKYASKDRHALFDWEIDKSKTQEVDGEQILLIKKGEKFCLYFPHEKQKCFFRPFWVPLSNMFLFSPVGPALFESEDEAKAEFVKYNQNKN